MTLAAFKSLNKNHQQYILLLHGSFIDERMFAENTVRLYQILDFYVEVHFEKDTNKIIRIRNFASTDRLLPYLQNINIDKLLQETIY